MCEDFMDIPRSKLPIVNENTTQICNLFRVKINIDNNEDDSANVKIKVVYESGNESSKDIVNKAKEYIKSLTGIGDDHCSCTSYYEPRVFEILQKNHDNIEKQSQAVVRFCRDRSTVLISGQSFNVAVAKSLMERVNYSLSTCDNSSGRLVVNTNPATAATTTTSTLQDVFGVSRYGNGNTGTSEEECNNKHTTLMHTLSPGGESSHDSCYDSDCSPSSSRRNSTHHLDADFHSDVSRTTSDTLAAELVEKEDVKSVGDLVGSLNNYSSSKSSAQTVDNTPLTDLLPSNEFTSKVEFALKLGYTEEQIKSALVKLGTDVDQNALLSELIKLGSQDPQSTTTKVNVSSVNSSCSSNRSHLSLEVSKSLTPLERKSSGGHNDDHTNLRPIVIDGSNVAMSHGNKEVFSCQGIKLAVDFFRQRGHVEITVFVPQWRKEASRTDSPISDQEVLYDLERDKQLVFTPARRVGGKRVICYDDRYIIKLASENGGVIVSNDNYRDLLNESPEFKQVIEERLLMYSFVNDRFMPPDDPLGRHGPTLDQYLRKDPVTQESLPPVCPYGKKCTYGNKCKYYHPERGSAPHKSVTDKLKEEASIRIKHAKEKGILTSTNSIGDPRSLAGYSKKQLTTTKSLTHGQPQKKALSRTRSLIPDSSHPFDSSSPFGGRSLENLDIARSSSPVFLRSHSPSLTLTPAPTEQGNFDEHGESKGKTSPGSKNNYSSPRRSPSPRELSPRGSQQQRLGSSLKVPLNTHLAVMHEALRNVHSDPTSSFYNRSNVGTHVNLVKKLSDSGQLTCMDDNNCYLMHARGADSVQLHHPVTKSASIGEIGKQQPQEEKTVHKKLQRQLSLKGPEDPRIRGKQQQNKSNVPIVQFHGSAMPVRPIIQQQGQQQHMWNLHQQPGMHMYGNQMPFYQNIQIEPDLHRQSVYNMQAVNNMPVEFHGEQTKKLQETLKPPENLKGHTPLGRMSSAPEAFGGNSSRHQAVPKKSSPLMNRQNSNSDSHLNTQKDELMSDSDKETLHGVFGDPRWAFEGSISGQVREQVERSNQHKWLRKSQSAKESDVIYFMPDGSHQRKQNNVNQQLGGIKVAFGTASRTPLARTSGRTTPGAPLTNIQGMVVQPQQTTATIQQQFPVAEQQQISPANSVQTQRENNQSSCNNQTAGNDNNKENTEKDNRDQIFFHLCALFNEEKVRKVMAEHPEETNPQVLCAYLLAVT